jgi:F0F1-type ATP synthase membrane subunit b/b'
MKKLVIIVAILGAFILGMATPAFTQRDHPRIRAARGHLERAREELQNAAHDYRGHRVKAIEHVNKAIAECDRALEFPD